MSNTTTIPRLLTSKELAEVTGLSLWTVWELVKKGVDPPHVRIGRGFRFPENGVGPWLDNRLKEQARWRRRGCEASRQNGGCASWKGSRVPARLRGSSGRGTAARRRGTPFMRCWRQSYSGSVASANAVKESR